LPLTDRGSAIPAAARSQKRFALIKNRVADLLGDLFLQAAAAEVERAAVAAAQNAFLAALVITVR
jgi:hypothetical protein